MSPGNFVILQEFRWVCLLNLVPQCKIARVDDAQNVFKLIYVHSDLSIVWIQQTLIAGIRQVWWITHVQRKNLLKSLTEISCITYKFTNLKLICLRPPAETVWQYNRKWNTSWRKEKTDDTSFSQKQSTTKFNYMKTVLRGYNFGVLLWIFCAFHVPEKETVKVWRNYS